MLNDGNQYSHDLSNRDVAREQWRKYMISCGIPRGYLTDDMTLKKYGDKGKFFSNLIADYEKRCEYFSTKKVINLYGTESEDILYGIIRGLMMPVKTGNMEISMTGIVVDPVDIGDMERYDINQLLTYGVVAIPYFYIGDIKNPLSENAIYNMDRFIRSYVRQGKGILLLHSSHPIAEITWYSEGLLKDLVKYGRDVDSDSSN